MFLVDDLLNKALEAIKDEIVHRRDVSQEAVAHAREAMYRLAASLSETVEYLEGGLHNLKKTEGDIDLFSQALSNLVDQEHLQRNCSEAGVCRDLRIAQDELLQLQKEIRKPRSKKTINDLMYQIDGYEQVFVRAIREFLGTSRVFDIEALQNRKELDPELVVEVLSERTGKLRMIVNKIEDLLYDLRNNSVQILQ